jgi:hypothetical protein
MTRKSEEPLQKHTLLLYEGDYERLQTMYPDIGASVVIRKIIRDFIDRTHPPANVHIAADL